MHKLSIIAMSLVTLGGALRSQQLVVPPDMVFSSAASSPSTSFLASAWRSTAFRFQMMYANQMFGAAGVTGPITINRLRFRAKDGERNLGGQSWAGVTVRLYDTPTSPATVMTGTTSSLASTLTVIQSAAGLLPFQFESGGSDPQRCFALGFTSGPNAGLFRLISTNDFTTITVSTPFPAAPAPGNTYNVVRAPIYYNNMARSFAANVGANVGAAEVFASVPVAPASGAVPNDYVIDLPLTTSAFTYDPTTMGNLVVEIAAAAAPAPNATSLVSFATSALAATSKARCNSAGGGAATVGLLSDLAAVVLLDWIGPGGASSAATPATVVSYGAPCNAQSQNVTQVFGAEDFDLRGLPNRSLLFTPDVVAAPTNYTVTGGATPVDLTQAVGAANILDDGVVTITPGWAAPFAFPGGTTTILSACTNGFVWLANRTSVDFTPTLDKWLGGGASNYSARIAPMWHDWHAGRNTVSNPGSGMYTNTDVSGGPGAFVTYVTWKEVGEYDTTGATGGHSVNTFQVAFTEATGQIEIRYGAMSGDHWGAGIAGFTRGGLGGGINSTDSGSRRLSAEVPSTTSGPNGPQGPLTLTTSARPVINTSTTFAASNIPATDTVGAYLFDVAPFAPGVPFPGLTEPSCLLSIAFTGSWGLVLDIPIGTVTPSFPFPFGVATYPAAFVGYHFYVQYASAPTVFGLFHTSNGLDMRLGYN